MRTFIACKFGSGVFINRKYYYLRFENNKNSDAQFNPDNRFAVMERFCLWPFYSLFSCSINWFCCSAGCCFDHVYPYYSLFSHYPNLSLCFGGGMDLCICLFFTSEYIGLFLSIPVFSCLLDDQIYSVHSIYQQWSAYVSSREQYPSIGTDF